MKIKHILLILSVAFVCRGETTVRRGRMTMGHSTEAPEIHPHREPQCVCVCVCVRVLMCLCVPARKRELNQCFTDWASM